MNGVLLGYRPNGPTYSFPRRAIKTKGAMVCKDRTPSNLRIFHIGRLDHIIINRLQMRHSTASYHY